MKHKSSVQAVEFLNRLETEVWCGAFVAAGGDSSKEWTKLCVGAALRVKWRSGSVKYVRKLPTQILPCSLHVLRERSTALQQGWSRVTINLVP